jgi:hypothetical protein
MKTYHGTDSISRSQLVRHWDVLRHKTYYRDRDRDQKMVQDESHGMNTLVAVF